MQRTYRVSRARAGLAGLLAMLVLFALPGTSIAGGLSTTNSGGSHSTILLARGSGYNGDHVATAQVRALQRGLQKLGWQPGPVDGLFGPRTEAAVVRFQQDAGLAADAIVGPHTSAALNRARTSPLRRGVGYAQPNGAPRVRVLQRRLLRHGLKPGPIDGIFGPRTEAALVRFQRSHGVPATGVATRRTGRLLAGAGPAPEPTANTGRKNAPQPAQQGGRTRLAESHPTANATGDHNTVDVPLLILIGALALLLGAALATLVMRLRPGGATSEATVPVAQTVIAEGRSHTESIGQFRGRVHALVIGRGGLWRRPETRYLVSDPQKEGGPFWVTHDEVTRLVATEPAAAEEAQPPPAPAPKPPEKVRALGYVSVLGDHELEGVQLEEQAEAIASLCEERGWELLEVIRDVEEAQDRGLDRPGLRYALDRIKRRDASCLVVSQLARLGSSAGDLSDVLQVVGYAGARLVAMDVELDTASPDASVAVEALSSVGNWDASQEETEPPARVAALRARQPRASGASVDDVAALKARIVSMREQGMTLQAIADQLNDEGVPTLGGGLKWRPSSVRYAVSTAQRSPEQPGEPPGGER